MQLFPRYSSLWEMIGAKGILDACYVTLAMSYYQPHRAYHNLSHINNCLDEFDSACSLALYLPEAEMALWYHDIVYDPMAKDNEEQSAEDLSNLCRCVGLPDEFRKRTMEFILATKHIVVPQDIDAQLVVDCDLSILGKPVAEFDAYEIGIRKEYSFVADDDFKKGRIAVLQGFLTRPSIYCTGFFQDKYETAARANLERSIARLGAK